MVYGRQTDGGSGDRCRGKAGGGAGAAGPRAVRELALYVYEYLLHVGAQKSAQTFLSERLLGPVLRRSRPPGNV
uniref:LisH domain-containing protein n=1 Tax=Apteryx owenii TaxID=8824 RepID=A0A8B9QZ62_APTOW